MGLGFSAFQYVLDLFPIIPKSSMLGDFTCAFWFRGLHKWWGPSEPDERHCYLYHSACHCAIAVNAMENTFIWRPFDRGEENTFTLSRPVYFPGSSLPIKCVLLSLDSYLGNIFWHCSSLSDFYNSRAEPWFTDPPSLLLTPCLLKTGRPSHVCVLGAFFTEWGRQRAYFSKNIELFSP